MLSQNKKPNPYKSKSCWAFTMNWSVSWKNQNVKNISKLYQDISLLELKHNDFPSILHPFLNPLFCLSFIGKLRFKKLY
jgi:hypothetical protein